jgi:hypothetical protein
MSKASFPDAGPPAERRQGNGSATPEAKKKQIGSVSGRGLKVFEK